MSKTLELYLTADELKETLELYNSTNSNYISLDGNLFDINKIVTILKPDHVKLDSHDKITLKFSYNDPSMKSVISVSFIEHDNSVFKFLEISKLISDSQISIIKCKIEELQIPNSNADHTAFKDKINDIAFNEALIFMTNGINDEDCEAVKNDFLSRYENWRSQIEEINTTGINSIFEIYKILYKYKISE